MAGRVCRRAPWLLLFAFVLALSPTAIAAAGDIAGQARELETMLIAPCCFSQQVSVHNSPAADEVKRDLRKRLAAGQTREEILGAYVAQYGKRILAEPPAEGIARGLYLIPPLTLLLTAGLVVLVVRRFTGGGGSRTAAPVPTAAPADQRLGAQLDDQLRDLD
jgi:cytochrome c-type biogenesis protein CcmH